MIGRHLVVFVWLNLQFSVLWQVDFQWVSCRSIFSFVSWQVDVQWGSCSSISSFLCHGWQTFSGLRVAQSFFFYVMVGRLLVGFVLLNLQFSVSWLVYFQWGSCSFFCVMVGRLLVGFVWLNVQSSMSWQVNFQWGSCGSISSFLCHDWQTFRGVRVAQTLVFCVMIGRHLVGFVQLKLQFSVSWLVDFQWVRVAQYLDFCVMISGLLVVFVWLNLQFSVSWQVDLQWGSCGSIFSFVSWQVDVWWGSCGSIFSFLCHGWWTFIGLRVAQSLVFYVMVGRLLVGFVWLNLQFSVSWLVDFWWVSCGSIFSFLGHGWQIFRGVRVTQSLIFCVMVDRLLVGFVWFNLQFSVSWQVDFQWDSCGSIFCFLCHGRQTFSAFVWPNLFQFSVSWLVDFQWDSCGSIFSFLGHGMQTFSWVRVAQSLVFCVMVGRLVVGFVRLNLQFSVSMLATFSGVRVAQSLFFCLMVGRLLVGFVWFNLQFSVSWFAYFQWGSWGSNFSFLCHGWQTFSGVREAQSLVFWVKVGDF